MYDKSKGIYEIWEIIMEDQNNLDKSIKSFTELVSITKEQKPDRPESL
jgi:hypothetical protein